MRLRISRQHIRPVLKHFNPSLLRQAFAENSSLVDELPGMMRASSDWGIRAITENFRNEKTLDSFLSHASSSDQIIIALHGYFAVGDHFTPVYKRTFEKEYNIPFCAPEYPTFRDISTSARYCGTLLKKVISATERKGTKIALMTHSLGCLVGLEMYYTRLSFKEQERISHLLLLCGPHHGTPLARHGYGRSARQMELESDYIRSWEEKYENLKDGEKVWSFSAPADRIVPSASVHLPIPHARNYCLSEFGLDHKISHVNLLYQTEIAHLLGQIITANRR